MKGGASWRILLIAASLLTPTDARPQTSDSAPRVPDPLAPFERLVGAKWHPDSRRVGW
jgi:hypothetical protein